MLYLVATPIGNLDDITLRALDTLREVDVVASEDTRKTGLLLKHFNISKPQIAFHEYNEQQAGERIESLLEAGKISGGRHQRGDPGHFRPRLYPGAQSPLNQYRCDHDTGPHGLCDGSGLIWSACSQFHLPWFCSPQAGRQVQIPGA